VAKLRPHARLFEKGEVLRVRRAKPIPIVINPPEQLVICGHASVTWAAKRDPGISTSPDAQLRIQVRCFRIDADKTRGACRKPGHPS
jgi:hypothetical protein